MKSDNATEVRNEEPQKRSIILPRWLWQQIEKDAHRCRRSQTKQIEAILACYYNLTEDVELNSQAIWQANEVVSQKRMKA